MKTPLIGLILLLGGGFPVPPALAQSSTATSTVFMSIPGSRIGTGIEGEVAEKGREGWHRLLAYSHEVTVPVDAGSGQVSGRRQHHPFSVVKLVNKGSPLLFQALVTHQTLSTVDIMIWTPAATGTETRLLTYTLTDATVVSIRPWMPNKSDPSTRDYPPAEEVSFAYRSIQVTFHDGNITATDTWSSPAE